MHQINLDEKLFREAERRAKAAGYRSVDEFVADTLELDFSAEQENFDDRFTPQVLAALDRISEQMEAGQSLSMEEVDDHLKGVREEWLKNHAG